MYAMQGASGMNCKSSEENKESGIAEGIDARIFFRPKGGAQFYTLQRYVEHSNSIICTNKYTYPKTS